MMYETHMGNASSPSPSSPTTSTTADERINEEKLTLAGNIPGITFPPRSYQLASFNVSAAKATTTTTTTTIDIATVSFPLTTTTNIATGNTVKMTNITMTAANIAKTVASTTATASTSAITEDASLSEMNQPGNSNLAKKRKLILHVDIRNTIIVADSVTSINVEQALNSYLTGVLWGREHQGKWCWVSDKPSLTQPESDTMTYYKYLEQKLVNEPEDRCRLRMATGDFTSEEIGRKFREHFDKHLELLRWRVDDKNAQVNHDSSEECKIDDKVTLSSRNNCNYNCSKPMSMIVDKGHRIDEYHYILPSFIKLINHLIESNRDFSIIIRTYGLDAPNVLTSIRHICRSGMHPNFRNKSQIPVHTNPGRIVRSSDKPHFSLMHVRRPCDSRQATYCRPSIKNANASFSTKNMKNESRNSCSLNKFQKFFEFKYYKFFTKKLNCYRNLRRCRNKRTELVKHLELNDENEICRFLNESRGISGYVDDFIYWQKNCYGSQTGKPLWLVLPGFKTFEEFFSCFNKNTQILSVPILDDFDIGVEHLKPPSTERFKYPKNHCPSLGGRLDSVETHHHIFFDDNIRVHDEDNIVNVRLFDRKSNTWRSISRDEAKYCKDIFLVQADLLESIENENFFIDNVELCERNLDKVLQLQ